MKSSIQVVVAISSSVSGSSPKNIYFLIKQCLEEINKISDCLLIARAWNRRVIFQQRKIIP